MINLDFKTYTKAILQRLNPDDFRPLCPYAQVPNPKWTSMAHSFYSRGGGA